MVKNQKTYILGIETSCDETAAAVLEFSKNGASRVLSNIVSSQIEIHKKYYGVVPEIAAREHVINIIPVIEEALAVAKIKPADLSAIVVTKGPGLITSLMIGVETAKTLALIWHKPLIEVNHITGHISANFIGEISKIKFPLLALTVSGGHTNLVLMNNFDKYKVIGETLDDAAGEAFDKAAKMMKIGYPGGPLISKMAAAIKPSWEAIKLPRPMMNNKNLNFSFSGLKTALLYKLQADKNWSKRIPEYCAEFQQAVVDVLIFKTLGAGVKFKVKTIALCGGVAANSLLRQELASKVKTKLPQVKFMMPDLKYTTDNAAMIAEAGYFKYKRKAFTVPSKVKADCNLELQ